MEDTFNPANIVQGEDGRWYYEGVDVTDRQAWWRCDKDPDHEPWQASIGQRTSADDVGCPACCAATLDEVHIDRHGQVFPSVDLRKVYELGEAVKLCGTYSIEYPTTPLRDNPFFPASEEAQRAAFGDTGPNYYCPKCRLVTPRLDPNDGYVTTCCGMSIGIDWSPDDDED